MEHEQQAATVSWFRLQYPRFALNLYANPNGAVLCDLPQHKRVVRMAYLAEEGFLSAIPDLFLAVPRNGLAGCYLEMKDQGRTFSALTKDQALCLNRLRCAGYGAYWAPGFDIARVILANYMEGRHSENARHQVINDSLDYCEIG